MFYFENPINETIHTLVDQNFRVARWLDTYGISFYEHLDSSLEDICRIKGMQFKNFNISHEGLIPQDTHQDLDILQGTKVDVVINYLKHHHYIFIKEQLPFIRRIIENLKAESKHDADLINDLKFVFPLFLEDFIHHIYEEEDSLFSYILALHKMVEEKTYSGGVYFSMENHSIQELAIEHSEDDDEMKGIRGIIQQHEISKISNLHLRVVFHELMDFDKALETHAKIENEILFPKALNLEKQARKIFGGKIKCN